ncbi:hypothetical protein ACVW17_004096 [Bradyrhizobium sp. USDA 4473]
MLISMPTGTSTIFGVFQAISFSQGKVGASLAPRGKLRLAFPGRKLGWSEPDFAAGHADTDDGSLTPARP